MRSLTVAGWRILAACWALIIAGLLMGRPPSWLAGAAVALGIAAFSVFAVSAALGARKFLRGRREAAEFRAGLPQPRRGGPLAAVRVAIDLNVRVRGNQTFAGFGDVRIPGGDPAAVLLLEDIRPGTRVLAVEEETGIVADGEITDVDTERGLVYLAVDWGGFRDDPEATEDPSCE